MEPFELLQMAHAFGPRELVHFHRDDHLVDADVPEPAVRVTVGRQPRMAAVDEQQDTGESGDSPLLLGACGKSVATPATPALLLGVP